MQPQVITPAAPGAPQTASQCPICGAGIYRAGSTQRCGRCGFSQCESCSGEVAQEGDE